MFKLKYSEKAIKQISKIDKTNQKFIISWLSKNINNCENPRKNGKALTGNKKGLWRYRVGKYRIICDIKDNELIILALEIGHRKEIYR